ncbi:hypothetical protein [Euzebya tangerina]|uniref:hypothetical protein n=1 Tax=Euzebya tangerina TaxID=591198 RepID=UPI0013C350C2|nr:hypothetical protein [Euzebya tangerina]
MTAPTPSPPAADAPRVDRASRRSFLLASATIATGVAVAGRAALDHRTNRSLAAMAREPGRKLSVGFLASATDPHAIDWDDRPRIVPARQAPSVALRSARGSVDGVTPGVIPDHNLDVLMAGPGGAAPNQFQAWSVTDGVAAHPVDFAVPTGDLALGLVVGTPDGRTTHTVLTTSATSALPTLAAGTYLIGLADDVWEAPLTAPSADDPAWTELASVLVSIRHT